MTDERKPCVGEVWESHGLYGNSRVLWTDGSHVVAKVGDQNPFLDTVEDYQRSRYPVIAAETPAQFGPSAVAEHVARTLHPNTETPREDMLKLMDCPFCGGKLTWQACDTFVYCGGCGILVDSGSSVADTASMWNTRTPTPPAEPAPDAMQTCPTCEGTRHASVGAGCSTCHSTGEVPAEQEGVRLKCKGCGHIWRVSVVPFRCPVCFTPDPAWEGGPYLDKLPAEPAPDEEREPVGELLNYLERECDARESLATANRYRHPHRADREQNMADRYRRWRNAVRDLVAKLAVFRKAVK